MVRIDGGRARLPLLRTGIQPIRLDLYRRAGRWLDAHAAPDARIGALEVGTVGFYSRRHVHDMLGLVSPESLAPLRDGDLVGAFRAGRPDYFLYFSPQAAFLDRVLEAPGLAGDWREVARFDGPAQAVIVYQHAGGRVAATAAEDGAGDVLRWSPAPTAVSEEEP